MNGKNAALKTAFFILCIILPIRSFGFLSNYDTLYICNGESRWLFVDQNADSVYWSTGSNLDSVQVNSPGLYTNNWYLNSNIYSDSIYVLLNSISSTPDTNYFNTANNGIGGVFTSGTDLSWEFSDQSRFGPFNPATIVSNPTTAWYSSPWSTANWISGVADGNHASGVWDTTYYFRNRFLLPCANECGQSVSDSGSYCIDLEFFADNYIAEIWINGVAQFAQYGIPVINNYNALGFQNGNQRSLQLCNHFQTGENEIVVKLQSSAYAYGFLCQTNTAYLNGGSNNLDTGNFDVCDSLSFQGTTYFSDTLVSGFSINQDRCTQKYFDIKIEEKYSDTSTISSCSPIVWNGLNLDSTGIFFVNYTNSRGCDSIKYVSFERLVEYSDSIPVSSCDSVVIKNQKYYSNAILIDSLSSVDGCDSIIYFDIEVLNSFSDTIILSSCDSLSLNNQIYYGNLVLGDTVNSISGCDSITYFDIRISNSIIDTSSISSCSPISFGGQIMDSTGMYLFSYSAQNSCDSNIYIDFILDENYDSTYSLFNGCDSLTIGSFGTFITSSLVVDSLKNQYGCDSLVFFDIKIQLSLKDSVFIESCSNINWRGYSIFNTGFYSDTLSSIDGCDSITFLNFTLLKSDIDTINQEACDSLWWNGFKLYQSGFYSDTLINLFGCDSITILDLEIQPSVSSNETIKACNEIDIGGQVYTVSDTIIIYNTSVFNCDSTHFIFLDIEKPIKSNLNDTLNICFKNSNLIPLPPDHYLWNYDIIPQSIYDLSLDTSGYYELKYLMINEECSDTLVQFLKIEECDYSIWVPNTFTPNSDGVNDNFEIKARNLFDFKIEIFNRWGDLVLLSEDQDFSFSGDSDEKMNMQTTYSYRITFKYKLSNGRFSNKKTLLGSIVAIQ